jgi:hypothetical protein
LIAPIRALRLIVQLDRSRAAGQGEFRRVDTDSAKQAVQALVSGVVGILSIASRYRDLGYAGVLPVVVPVVDVPWQAQQCYRLGLYDWIVRTLVGDHRFRNRDLAPPLAELHDQWKINIPRHVVEDKVPIGIGQRRGNGLA